MAPAHPISLACPRCGEEEAIRLEAATPDSMTLACNRCDHVIEADAALDLLSPEVLAELKVRLARACLLGQPVLSTERYH
jgi:hypothetical protein